MKDPVDPTAAELQQWASKPEAAELESVRRWAQRAATLLAGERRDHAFWFGLGWRDLISA